MSLPGETETITVEPLQVPEPIEVPEQPSKPVEEPVPA